MEMSFYQEVPGTMPWHFPPTWQFPQQIEGDGQMSSGANSPASSSTAAGKAAPADGSDSKGDKGDLKAAWANGEVEAMKAELRAHDKGMPDTIYAVTDKSPSITPTPNSATVMRQAQKSLEGRWHQNPNKIVGLLALPLS